MCGLVSLICQGQGVLTIDQLAFQSFRRSLPKLISQKQEFRKSKRYNRYETSLGICDDNVRMSSLAKSPVLAKIHNYDAEIL